MEEYDTNLLGSFFAFQVFAKRNGKLLPNGEYQVDVDWQTGLMDGAQVEFMVGLAINRIMCDEVRYKKTYFAALILMTAAIFTPLFTTSDAMLLAGQVVSGIP